MTDTKRKYKFSWDLIGADLAVARPSLGPSTRIEVYRLFQFTLRDILEQTYGTDAADKMFKHAGVTAGKAFYEQFCSEAKDISEFLKIVQDLFKDLGMGIFRVEAFDPETLACTLTVDEDLDCSGLPEIDDEICIYDEGFIQGLLESFTGKTYDVHEIDCWCAGARTCRFSASANE